MLGFFDKIAYQSSLGSFADVGRTERVHPPALRLPTRDQGAYARDLMKRVLRETRAKCFPNLSLRRIAQVEHPRSCREVGHGLQIPDDD